MLGPPDTAPDLSEQLNEGVTAHPNLETLSPFVYEPLDLDKQVFRLIRARKWKRNSPIEIEMWHSEMSTEYRCLSYMWGEQPSTYGVLLSGKSFWVRKNLYDFLEFASRTYPGEPIWIDAICIDQNNTAERGHQVQRMGAIYSRASEVLIWLGKDIAIEEIVQWVPPDMIIPSSRSRLVTTYGELPAFEGAREQMIIICGHPYWKRAWIAQEILLQARVTIIHPPACMG